MSYPGYTTDQLTPELLQKWQMTQDQQKQQAMANALKGQEADPRTPYAGLANAGRDLNSAFFMKSMQDKRNSAPVTVMGGTMPSMDATVGGIPRQLPGKSIGPISSSLPALNNGSFFGKLFGMGG